MQNGPAVGSQAAPVAEAHLLVCVKCRALRHEKREPQRSLLCAHMPLQAGQHAEEMAEVREEVAAKARAALAAQVRAGSGAGRREASSVRAVRECAPLLAARAGCDAVHRLWRTRARVPPP